MLLTSTLRKLVRLSGSKVKIVFNEKIEFSVSITTKDNYHCNLHIEDVKGSFTNFKIATKNLIPLPFNKDTQCYKANAIHLQSELYFILECEVEYKIVNSVTWSKEFRVPAEELTFLNVFECYEGQISFAHYEFYKLYYYIKKFEEGFVELSIKNPHNIQINGDRTDLNYIAPACQDLQYHLSFVYDPKVMEILDKDYQGVPQDVEKEVSSTAAESESAVTSYNESSSSKSNAEEDASKIPSEDSESVPKPDETSLQNEERQINETTSEAYPNATIETTTATSNKINSKTVNQNLLDDSVPEESAPVEHQSPVKDLLQVSEIEFEEETIDHEEDKNKDAKQTTTTENSKIIEAVDDSILDDTFSTEIQIPVNSSKPVTEIEFDENTIATENESTEKPETKSQNMIFATSYKINDYVILISSDRKRIFSSASLLTRHSYIFATILRKIKKSPVKINMEEFDAETIYAALDFLNGKHDVIIKKEIQLYYFADKYSLRDLKNACCSRFDKMLTNNNVCEIIQIAYANYFEELKLKCIEIIRTCTQAIHESDINALPSEIYSEIFVEVF